MTAPSAPSGILTEMGTVMRLLDVTVNVPISTVAMPSSNTGGDNIPVTAHNGEIRILSTLTPTPTPINTPVPTQTPSPGGDTYEPDDSSQDAGQIYSETPQEHSIDPVGDRDWVNFSLDINSAVSIETSGDTKIRLYDSTLNLIEENDDSIDEDLSRIKRLCGMGALPGGMYYIEVSKYADNSVINSYMITYSSTSCPAINPVQESSLYLPLISRR